MNIYSYDYGNREVGNMRGAYCESEIRHPENIERARQSMAADPDLADAGWFVTVGMARTHFTA
jgi:hypothetical protein